MFEFSIIDSHVHFYDPAALPYGWITRLPSSLQRAHGVTEFRADALGVDISKAAVVEFLVDATSNLDEAKWLERLAGVQPLIGAIVANLPVEHGDGIAADLERLLDLPHVRSIRRILDGQYDQVLEPDFIAGVRAVGRYGLPFELGVSHYGLVFALELAKRCPGTHFILDHLATPAIRYGLWEPWASQIAALAALPNVVAKLSGLLAGIDPAGWQPAQITPYIRHAIACFGFDRLMFGSDWPMLTLAASYADWLAIVEMAISGATDGERRLLYRDTAIRLYRIED